jgi:hypothetical protein
MSFHSLHSGTIVKGDIIAIASDNFIQLGFYIGRGKGGTLQYYSLDGMAWRENNKPDERPDRWAKAYINTPHSGRVIKVDVKSLCIDKLVQYEKATRYLERHGIKLNEE